MRRLLVAASLVGLAFVAAAARTVETSGQAARDQKELQALLEQLQKIPEGSRIRVQLVDGQTLEAQLLEVTATSIRILPVKGDVSERVVALDQIKRVQRVNGSLAKKIVLWTAVGFLALIGIGVATCSASA